ncbi:MULTISPECIES: cysteine hydrolase family protein [unclassified Rhizobium]|uniref:cysteine hydrolase family protein n=1 Tax=unclassified Rhizobium TaxID=2613769 RepID=UPI000715A369|nr:MULTISPECIES: cysteine hydrolase family protein [unclassified Rhizobium]KQS87770.1 isochorismatase [Rhizobium sp. Leaf386]KQS94672.1 isochorismatase [Rhizobium sp. Leaf391]KQU01686.1 isochorismatase [Rhizobium sp. Leaf453]
MTTALIIIDVQNAIVEGAGTPERQSAIDAALTETVGRIQSIQARARASHIPVILVQHDGGPGDRLARSSNGWGLRHEIAPVPGETVVHKKACDSFFQTNLQDELDRLSITHLVIGGCMTQFCVDTTVRRAVSLGYDVTLLSDGHATGDMGDLTFPQIIAHHNRLLGGFDAGAHHVELRRCDEISF